MRSLIGGIRARAAGTVAGVMTAALLGGGLLGPPGATAAAAAGDPPADPTSLVNPFVGTQNFGNTFPGASAPFGMVQVSPDTGGQGGYDYDQTTIHGFSQTHLSGVGCGVGGELPDHADDRRGHSTSTRTRYALRRISHDDEEAAPGYYRVGLKTYGIDAELTATGAPAGSATPSRPPARPMCCSTPARPTAASSAPRSTSSATGPSRAGCTAGNFCAGKDRAHRLFPRHVRPALRLLRHLERHDPHRRRARGVAARAATAPGSRFDTSEDRRRDGQGRPVVHRRRRRARRTSPAETGDGFDFDATRAALHDTWGDELDTVRVAGGTDERQTRLLHRALPLAAAPQPRRRRGRPLHRLGRRRRTRADGYTPYQNFSLWDTYRPQNQLLELLAPDVARDVALSVLAIGREGGWLPRWALANSETNIMTGDPVTPFLVEAW